MEAIIMAGGRGTRLRPYTTNLPKPLMPLDGVPVIEILIRQLACHGVNRATVVACYLAPLLRQFLCLRQFPEMEITVFEEPAPLGTAGCLGLIERPRRRSWSSTAICSPRSTSGSWASSTAGTRPPPRSPRCGGRFRSTWVWLRWTPRDACKRTSKNPSGKSSSAWAFVASIPRCASTLPQARP